jgi:predicted N-formylglutamate amidohydrolase
MHSLNQEYRDNLVSENEPYPCGISNVSKESSWVLLCEHAGKRIPDSLEMLGLPQKEIDRHIGWDIGILDVAQSLSSTLDAPLFFQRYSRLVIDCNRPLTSDVLIPEKSDNTLIPGNVNLSENERTARINGIWKPYQDTIRTCLEKKPRPGPVVISLHSFTPVFQGQKRPGHIGLLYNRFSDTALFLKNWFNTHEPLLKIGLNHPYEVSDEEDYTIPVFGEQMGFPHVLIEIRQDLIEKKETRKKWVDIFSRALLELKTTN